VAAPSAPLVRGALDDDEPTSPPGVPTVAEVERPSLEPPRAPSSGGRNRVAEFRPGGRPGTEEPDAAEPTGARPLSPEMLSVSRGEPVEPPREVEITGARPLSPEMLSVSRGERAAPAMARTPMEPSPEQRAALAHERAGVDRSATLPRGLIVGTVVGLLGLMAVLVFALRGVTAPPPPPPPSTARLSVHSTPPGADLRVDGVARGVTPAVLELSPGLHHVAAAVRDGGESAADVALDAGDRQTVELTLEVPPGPAPTDAGVPALDAGAAAPDAGAVALARPPAKRGRREPPQGTFSLETTPPTTAYLGHTRLGPTPLVAVPLPVGTHSIRVLNPERHLDRTLKVTIHKDQLTTQRVRLR
jgi:hypothetical protein